MNWHKVAEFSGDVDLSDVHQYFNQRGLLHRITESSGSQELWLADERHLAEARSFLQAWQSGEIQLELVAQAEGQQRSRHADGSGGFAGAARAAPFSLVLVLLGIIGYVIASWAPDTGWMWGLTFQNFQMTASGLMHEPVLQPYSRGEFWRVITPTFLHFNALHIVFNALWIWEFGRRLERYFSLLAYLNIFFVTAIGANIVQYLTATNAPFGGLSGVVYGYMGVLFVASRIAPHPALAVPPGIFGFMLVWLALGVFGVIDLFMPGSGSVGNGAHLGGLLFGLLIGYLLLHKASRQR